MKFVAVKTAEQQGRMMLFRTRDLLVRQRTQTINALRGHLAEFGVVAAQGRVHADRLAPALEDPGSDLPDTGRELGTLLLEQIAGFNARIECLEKEIHASARQDVEARRLMSVPGIGPIIAMAIQAFAPSMETFRRGRDFAAWLGLVPRQHSTGGKARLGKISKMGQRDLRRLLITSAMAVVRWAIRRVKTKGQQARAMLFRTRDLLVRQRTQTINALRGHLAEFGVIAPQGPAHVTRLASALENPGSGLPELARELGGLLLEQIAGLSEKIVGLEKELRASARQDEAASRLMTIPGVGPITAMALQAFAPPLESFRRGRDFAAWLGLVPKQHTTGGKPRLGKISKMGQRDLRRLLIAGAMAEISWAVRRGRTKDPWLASMLERKPRKVVAVALANRMARIVWALTTTKTIYRAPAAV